MDKQTKPLYTIGYSGFTPDEFIAVLKKNEIDVVADVRSSPYSKFRPEYNHDNLKALLKNDDIRHVFLGDLVGARIDDKACYVNGKADYDLIAAHPKFREGLNRIRAGMEKYRIALLCAEKDPITCHRTILICRNLKGNDIRIFHIIDSGRVETQEECEKRLIKYLKLDQRKLFHDDSDLVADAYRMQADKIAYVAETGAGYTVEEGEG